MTESERPDRSKILAGMRLGGRLPAGERRLIVVDEQGARV